MGATFPVSSHWESLPAPQQQRRIGLTMLSANSLWPGCSLWPSMGQIFSRDPWLDPLLILFSLNPVSSLKGPWDFVSGHWGKRSIDHRFICIHLHCPLSQSGFSSTPTFSLGFGLIFFFLFYCSFNAKKLLPPKKLFLLSLLATLGVLNFSQHLTLNISLEICSISS